MRTVFDQRRDNLRELYRNRSPEKPGKIVGFLLLLRFSMCYSCYIANAKGERKMMNHPQVIAGSERNIGTCPAGPLIAWDEIYPDGSVKTFKEIYNIVTGASGTQYGCRLVVPA